MAVWNFSTWNPSKGQIPPSVSKFQQLWKWICNICGASLWVCSWHRTACAAPQSLYILLPLLWQGTAEQPQSFGWLCLFLVHLHTYPYPWCIHTNTGLHKSTAKLHSELHENEKVCVFCSSDTECLLSDLLLVEHLASSTEQPRRGYKRDSYSCTLYCRVPEYGKDLLIGELLLKIKIVLHTAARL